MIFIKWKSFEKLCRTTGGLLQSVKMLSPVRKNIETQIISQDIIRSPIFHAIIEKKSRA